MHSMMATTRWVRPMMRLPSSSRPRSFVASSQTRPRPLTLTSASLVTPVRLPPQSLAVNAPTSMYRPVMMMVARRNASTTALSRAQRRRRNKKQAKQSLRENVLEQVVEPPKMVYGPTGRPVMTRERWSEIIRHTTHPSYKKLALDNSKHRLYNVQQKLMFRQQMSHHVEKRGRENLFVATTTTTLPSILLTHHNLGSSASSSSSPSNTSSTPFELVSVGMDRSKKQAEGLAAIDLICQLQESHGINVTDPPDIRTLMVQEAKETLQAHVMRAHLRLEFVHASWPRFDNIRPATALDYDYNEKDDSNQHPNQINGDSFVADVQVRVGGIPVLATGRPGRSKAEAQDHALVALAGDDSVLLEQVVGMKRINECNAHLQASPAGHIATLRVPPLPDEAFDDILECMGTPEDRSKRRNHFLQLKQTFESHFYRHQQQQQNKTLTNPPANLTILGHAGATQTNHSSAVNQAFREQELARRKKALDHPNGPEGKLLSIRDNLPIQAIRTDFLEALQTHGVVVVSGGTGSGKTTQCPQYILEHAILESKGASASETRIVVTQPRRIAAISVAERVAAERGEPIGTSVGYAVRFQRKPPRDEGATIEFVTTGVLLRRLMNQPSLDGVSHVVIDEVHERDIDTDFLLVLLRELLVQRPELRLVLMSATLDADSFAHYFTRGRLDATTTTNVAPVVAPPPVPVLSVPAQPRHPVEVVYLEDVAGESKEMENANHDFSSELQRLARSLLQVQDEQLQLELEEADAEEAAALMLETRSLEHAEESGKRFVLDDQSSSDDSDSDSENESDLERDGVVDSSSDRSSSFRVKTLRHALSIRNKGTSKPVVSSLKTNRKRADKREISEITVRLVSGIAQHLSRMEINAGNKGSILCFLPGWDEIKATMAALESADGDLKRKMQILPLHSTIPQDDQQKVFLPAPDGTVKVILATNIAESSVTIDDVLAVVDSGLVRELNWDAESSMSTMETRTTSKASATQRLGRAGRVAPGKCFRIYSRGTLQAMFERPLPEIQRSALEATCLQTCSMKNDGVEKFLQKAMDPPPEEAVAFAMDRLKKLGAIQVDDTRFGGEMLTPLGRCLSRLPLDPGIGRMLIMGCTMQNLDPVLTAAACFSSRDPFYTPPGMRDEARIIRQSFSETSDLMATVRAYDEFQNTIRQDGWDAARRWASENFVSVVAMNSIQSVRSQLLGELNKIGLVSKRDLVNFRSKMKMLHYDAEVNRNAGCDMLNSAVWATGLPGNLSARHHSGNFGAIRTRMEQQAGLHPSSVAFYRQPPKDIKLPKWYFYHEMVLSSDVFLRGCTAMQPEQIMLFGGYSLDSPQLSASLSPIKTDRARAITTQDANRFISDDLFSALMDNQNSNITSDTNGTVLDDWIIVQGSCKETINLLSDVRQEINAALEFKAMHPRKALPENLQTIINAVADMYCMLDMELDGEAEEEEP